MVKAQRYQVWPDGHIEGKLHCEGTPFEHIAAVGIYYVDVDERLQGGALELVRFDGGELVTEPVRVSSGVAVIFDNRQEERADRLTGCQYHRMARLSLPHQAYYGNKGERYHTRNLTEAQVLEWAPAERVILSFFPRRSSRHS
jgi:hypothetical protein